MLTWLLDGLPINVSVWQLADDESVYGEDAGKFVLTTPDGENEIFDLIFDDEHLAEECARAHGWNVVPLTL